MHRHGERPLLREDLAATYDAFETPARGARRDRAARRRRAPRVPRRRSASATLAAVDEHGVATRCCTSWSSSTSSSTSRRCSRRCSSRGSSGFDPADPRAAAAPSPAPGAHTGLEFVDVPAGECTIGARRRRLRLRQRAPAGTAVAVARLPDRRARRSPTRPGWRFVEGGGYERREWWTDEAWAWKEQYDITRPGALGAPDRRPWSARLGRCEPLHPDRPVVHVSWFEADAFARAHGARLPTEIEWEKAATWDQATQTGRPYPGAPTPGARRARQPRPARVRDRAGRRASRRRVALRLPRDDRRRLGVDRDPVRRLPRASSRIPTASTPRSSSAALPRPARRLVGDASRASPRRPSATGTTPSAARSSPACGSRRDV